jgi:SAM-dependent methyltransferase
MPEDNIDPEKYVIGRIHPDDDMLTKRDGHPNEESYIQYRGVGLSALANIEEALEVVNMKPENIRYCLDMACGYGRVLRVLQTRIDASKITACDISEAAVEFCRSEFGAEPLVSDADFRRIHFKRKYDLIWVGSLFTHISEKRFSLLLEVLYNVLEHRGVLVFTTHGQHSLDLMGKNVYHAQFPEREKLLEILRNKGYYFTPYAHSKDYGISICLPEYVIGKTSELFLRRYRLLRYKFRGWAWHQDVYAYQRL